MLRAGAERLYRATTDKKLKETVALELSYFNSNVQLLKEELADLNSSVDIYQNNNAYHAVPMIPLGLKETLDVDFREPFKDFILEHYSEDANKYDDAITELLEIRQAMRTPTRDKNGTTLLFRYYSQLYYIERRFFPPDRNLGIHFEWYDSLTGVPSNQRTVAFEKASVLFNIAALYTQIGARQDRTKGTGIDASVDSFLRAASMFHYIRNNFSNAPSMDLRAETLEMLVNLMLAQARECIFEKFLLSNPEKKNIESCLEAGQEAAQVADAYNKVHKCISAAPVKDYVPYSWISLVLVKSKYYRALSHYYVALGLLDYCDDLTSTVKDMLDCIQMCDQNKMTIIDIKVPKTSDERLLLGISHLKMALLLHEESLWEHQMCRQRRQIDSLQEKLRAARDRALQKYDDTEEEDDFRDVFDPPQIQASTKYQLTLTLPDFSLYKVKDLFHNLGPITIFSARHHWTAPRTVNLHKSAEESYGISVRGDAPVIVAAVDAGSLAEAAGVKEGDFIVATGDTDTKWCKHEEVVSLIQSAQNNLLMKLVTPTDRNYLRPRESSTNSPVSYSSSGSSTASVSSGTTERMSISGSMSSSKNKDSQKRLTWNPFRRALSRDRSDGHSLTYSSGTHRYYTSATLS